MKNKTIILVLIFLAIITSCLFAQSKEDMQSNFLQDFATVQPSKWKELINKSNLIDENFITLCRDAAYYAMVKNDMAEAYKLCYIADLSAQKLKRKDNYRLGLAYYCYNKNYHDKSLTVCNILEKENFSDARLPLIMGLIYKEQKNYASALKYFEKANKLDPENYDIHYNLGLMYIEVGDKEKAKLEFQKSMELNPGKKEAKKASETLEKENISTESLSSLMEKAKKALEENKNDEADKYLKKCLEIDPKNYEVYLLLGKLSAQAGDYKISLSYLKQSIDLYDKDPQTYYYLGYVYERLYDKDQKDINLLFEAKTNYLKSSDLDFKYSFVKKDAARIDEKIEKHNKGQTPSVKGQEKADNEGQETTTNQINNKEETK